MMSTIKLAFVLLCLIQVAKCVYDDYDDNTYQDNTDRKKAGATDFELIALTNEDMPQKIRIKAKFSNNFNIVLNKVEGVLKDPGSQSDVYVHNSKSGPQKQTTANLAFQMYRSYDNSAYGTLIKNTDLDGMGIKTSQKYRFMGSIIYNGVQYDLTPGVFKAKGNGGKYFNQVLQKRALNVGARDSDSDILDAIKTTTTKKPTTTTNKKPLVTTPKPTTTTTKAKKIGKRALGGSIKNFYIEYLVVLDSSVYQKYKALYPTLSSDMLLQYLKIQYTHIINGVNTRFQNSLMYDPDMRISVNVANILIYTNQSDTQWSNSTLVGATGYLTYNGKGTVVTTLGYAQFNAAILAGRFPFTWDYAGVYTDKDIWDQNTALAPASRSAVAAYTVVSGMCSASNSFSLIEDMSFYDISLALHELGHSLGARHDGVGTSIACAPTDNYLMTPVFGRYAPSPNQNLFSNCSINAFKSLLYNLTDGTVKTGKCLLNLPGTPPSVYFGTNYLPGSLWTLEDQCKFLYGPLSYYSGCVNTAPCQSMFCYDPSFGCTSVAGQGAADGSPCGTNMVCYLGACVSKTGLTTVAPSPCLTSGICLNGGTCVSVSNFYLCNCPVNYTGKNCGTFIGTTAAPVG